MHKIMAVLLWGMILSGCGTTGPAGGGRDSPQGGEAAVHVLEPAAPRWVSDPYAVYDRSAWVAAVGHGSSREEAERNALTALSAFFGQSIQSDLQAVQRELRTVLDGAVADSRFTSDITEALRRSVKMESLVGVEIRDIWQDPQSRYYAMAVMEKAQAAKLYADLIAANISVIEILTSLPEEEKYSLEGMVNYNLAAAAAGALDIFGTVLSVIGSAGDVGGLKRGEEYRIAAAEILRHIPIQVRVDDDKSDRIHGAFAAALTGAGFRTGGEAGRYVLEVKTVFSEMALDSPYKWFRYEINARLIDKSDGTVLLPYSISGREGHGLLEEAEKRAVMAAEKRIQESYGEHVEAFLARLSERLSDKIF